LRNGDRCALLAANGIHWVAMDLAIMAEGLIVVPLYSRQAPAELVSMMKDCSPSLICCGDAALRDAILREWPEAPAQILLDEVFADRDSGLSPRAGPRSTSPGAPAPHEGSDVVAIIYTLAPQAKLGVMLTTGNVDTSEMHLGATRHPDEPPSW
jgi:long-subunit acyl-CoA synthetase (AMP-forming)